MRHVVFRSMGDEADPKHTKEMLAGKEVPTLCLTVTTIDGEGDICPNCQWIMLGTMRRFGLNREVYWDERDIQFLVDVDEGFYVVGGEEKFGVIISYTRTDGTKGYIHEDFKPEEAGRALSMLFAAAAKRIEEAVDDATEPYRAALDQGVQASRDKGVD